MEETAATSCHQCGTPRTGSFCRMCGAPNAERTSAPSKRPTARLVSTVLGVVAVATIGWAASRHGTPTAAPAPVGAAAEVPDLSSLTPTEQFLRLADRIESSVQSGDTAAVVRFFPMMEGAYEKLPEGERTIDARIHIALLRAQVGHFPAATAQIDTIVASAAQHLFVDYLRALIADYQGDAAAARAARVAFRAHFADEIAINRPEYLMHRKLLDDFLATTPTP